MTDFSFVGGLLVNACIPTVKGQKKYLWLKNKKTENHFAPNTFFYFFFGKQKEKFSSGSICIFHVTISPKFVFQRQ